MREFLAGVPTIRQTERQEKTAAGVRDLAGITPIVLLGRVDGAQHQRMRHLHLLRVRKSTIVDRVGENRC